MNNKTMDILYYEDINECADNIFHIYKLIILFKNI